MLGHHTSDFNYGKHLSLSTLHFEYFVRSKSFGAQEAFVIWLSVPLQVVGIVLVMGLVLICPGPSGAIIPVGDGEDDLGAHWVGPSARIEADCEVLLVEPEPVTLEGHEPNSFALALPAFSVVALLQFELSFC